MPGRLGGKDGSPKALIGLGNVHWMMLANSNGCPAGSRGKGFVGVGWVSSGWDGIKGKHVAGMHNTRMLVLTLHLGRQWWQGFERVLEAQSPWTPSSVLVIDSASFYSSSVAVENIVPMYPFKHSSTIQPDCGLLSWALVFPGPLQGKNCILKQDNRSSLSEWFYSSVLTMLFKVKLGTRSLSWVILKNI